MRRILSFILIVSMCLSSIPTSYAMLNENDYRAGTTVEYTATNEESYTITVPAKLSPGQSGTVKLEGSWPQNRVITVTADKTVTLTNSINTSDTKTLDVYFDGIAEQGDNTRAQTFTQSVSVQTIKNALFGTWNGRLNYNVASSNVAVKSEIPVQATDKDGNDLNAKSYVIDGTEKDQLLSELQNSDLIENAEDVDALIEVKSDDFEDVADTTFDVSSIAQPGDQVVILHYNEETREWEYISQETVDGEGKVNADFSSYSPVAFVVVKQDGTLAPINPSAVPVYFEHPYSASFMGMYGTYIFHGDGSADLLVSGSLLESAPANTFSYGEGSIVNNNNPDDAFIVHDMDSFTYVVDGDEILFVRENNEVLYNKEYAYYVDGMKITLTFGEDGSAVYSIPGTEPQIFPAGSIKRDNSYIYTEGEEAMRGLVLQDGRIVVIEGTVFKVQGELKELTDYDAKSFYYDFRDIEGYLEVSLSDMYILRRVSAATPSVEEFSRGSVDIYVEGVLVESIYLTEEDVVQAYENVIIYQDFMVFIIEKDNTTISDSNTSVTFPLAGIYVLPLLTAEVGTDNVQIKVCWDLEVPDAPTSLSVDSIAYETIKLVEILGCEYSNNGRDWQDSPVFNNLYPGSTYTFYARYKATDDKAPSATVTTSATTINVPFPSAAMREETKITLVEHDGCEYSKDGINWQDSPVFDGLEIGTTYYFHIRYKATDTLPVSPSRSSGTSTVGIPPVPVVKYVDCGNIEIEKISGAVEYSHDGINWNYGNIRTELQPNTEYTVYVRYYATSNSVASQTRSVTVTTGQPKYVGFDRIELDKREGYKYQLYGSSEWIDEPIFTGLQSGYTYSIIAKLDDWNYMRYSIKTRDLPTAPTTLNFDEIAGEYVVITPIEGCEYSLDGTTWQDSNVLEGLHPDLNYTAYARYKAYDDVPESPAISKSFKSAAMDNVYYVGVTSNRLGNFTGCTAHYTDPADFPTPQRGDVYISGDYEYRYEKGYYTAPYNNVEWTDTYSYYYLRNAEYTDGWGVRVRDKNKTSYSQVLESIAGKPIKYLDCTFAGTKVVSLEDFVIPSGVVSLYRAFSWNDTLVTGPHIPETVQYLYFAFYDATALKGSLTIDANCFEWDEYNGCFNGAVAVGETLYISGRSKSLYLLESSDAYSDLTELDRVRVLNSKVMICGVLCDTGTTAMTWAEWCNSEYNTLGLYVNSSNYLSIKTEDHPYGVTLSAPMFDENGKYYSWWGFTASEYVKQGYHLDYDITRAEQDYQWERR